MDGEDDAADDGVAEKDELAAYLELSQIKYQYTTEADTMVWWRQHQAQFQI